MNVIYNKLNDKTNLLKEFFGYSFLCILCGVSLINAQEITIDGDVTVLEWSGAQKFELEY
jgi:5'(3')-deoxyribonucleotidase